MFQNRGFLILVILITCFAFIVGCTGSTSFMPSPTEASIKPADSIKPTETENTSPAISPEQVIKADIPGYISAGLPPRAQMPPELEKYYYLCQEIYLTNFDEGSEIWEYNAYFDNEIAVDLNGDGKEDNIKIIGGKILKYSEVYGGSEPFYYKSIIIDINGKKLNLKGPDDSYVFDLGGAIIDIDKKDGKKELYINAFQEQGDRTDYIITYDGAPKYILKEKGIDSAVPADGSGYIIIGEDYKDIFSYDKLWKLKEDRSGFEPVDTKYYPTIYQSFLWDEDGKWTEKEAAETEWDQYLYTKPNGTEKRKIKKGTQIYFGLYASKGWLMILDAKGNLLGWLDVKKVDIIKYTGYMFEMGDE